MLTTPIRENDWFVVIASKGGSQDHPDWYKNLVANPDIEATIDGEDGPDACPHRDRRRAN